MVDGDANKNTQDAAGFDSSALNFIEAQDLEETFQENLRFSLKLGDLRFSMKAEHLTTVSTGLDGCLAEEHLKDDQASATTSSLEIVLKALVTDWMNLEKLLETGEMSGLYADEWEWVKQLEPEDQATLREEVAVAIGEACEMKHPQPYATAVSSWKKRVEDLGVIH